MHLKTKCLNSHLSKDQAKILSEQKNSLVHWNSPGILLKDHSNRFREDFFTCFEQNGLDINAGIIVLPAMNHFCYNADDVKGVQTMVNLRQLNQIRELKAFLRNFFNFASCDSNFFWCFADNRKRTGFSKIRTELKNKEMIRAF